MALLDASISTSKRVSSSTAHTTDSAISLFRFSNASWASLDSGRVDVVVRGHIFSEKCLIHGEKYAKESKNPTETLQCQLEPRAARGVVGVQGQV